MEQNRTPKQYNSNLTIDEPIANESMMGTPKTKNQIISTKSFKQKYSFTKTIKTDDAGYKQWSKDGNEEFEQISSDEDKRTKTVLPIQQPLSSMLKYHSNKFSSIGGVSSFVQQKLAQTLSASSSLIEENVQITPFDQKKKIDIKSQTMQIVKRVSGPSFSQPKKLSILQFRPGRINVLGSRERQLSPKPSIFHQNESEEELNKTLKQSNSSEDQSVTEIFNEGCLHNFMHVRKAYAVTPQNSNPGIMFQSQTKNQMRNYAGCKVNPKIFKRESVLDQGILTTQVQNTEKRKGKRIFSIEINSSETECMETINDQFLIQMEITKIQNRITANHQPTEIKQEVNGQQVAKRYILSQSKATDEADQDDYFLNIETANDRSDKRQDVNNQNRMYKKFFQNEKKFFNPNKIKNAKNDVISQQNIQDMLNDQQVKDFIYAEDQNSTQMENLNEDAFEVVQKNPNYLTNKIVQKQEDYTSSVLTQVNPASLQQKKEEMNGIAKYKQQNQPPQPDQTYQHHPNILFQSVFKHKFKFAIDLITSNQADGKVTNSNGASLLHVLFANFDRNKRYNEQLATILIEVCHVDVNLLDNDGKTALHVAIGKNQQKAIQYAFLHNQKLSVKSNNTQMFDFGQVNKSARTPLHYAVKKSNYDAFIFIMNNKIGDCFKRDKDLHTPRQLTYINTALYRILIQEEKNQVLRMIENYELNKCKKRLQDRNGAFTRRKFENFTKLQKEYQSETTTMVFDTVRSYKTSHRWQTSNNEEENQVVKKIPLPIGSLKQSFSIDRDSHYASVNLHKYHSNQDKIDDQFSTNIPGIQHPNLSQMYNLHSYELKKNNHLEVDFTCQILKPELKHVLQSLRDIPINMKILLKKDYQMQERQPDQFEFTLGQPKSPTVLSSVNENEPFILDAQMSVTERLFGVTHENFIPTEAFEMILKQNLNRPTVKGQTHQIPQKNFDQSLIQQPTDDLRQENQQVKRELIQSVEGWMVLSKSLLDQEPNQSIVPNTAQLKQKELNTKNTLRKDLDIKSKVEEVYEEESTQRSPYFNDSQGIFNFDAQIQSKLDDLPQYQIIADNETSQSSSIRRRQYENAQSYNKKVINTKSKTDAKDLGFKLPSNGNNTSIDSKKVALSSDEQKNNIFISNLNINVNVNINISLPQGQSIDPELAKQISQIQGRNRSPTKPMHERMKLPNKVMTETKLNNRIESANETMLNEHSFMTSGEENVEASFRSILGLSGIHDKQPNQILNKLSQPILQAVQKSNHKQEGQNIFIENISIDDTCNNIQATPEQRKQQHLVSGYGIQDTILRDQAVRFQAHQSTIAYDNARKAKQNVIYQSCDIQGDSIDCGHMFSMKTSGIIFNQMAKAPSNCIEKNISNARTDGFGILSENLETSFTGNTPCKPLRGGPIKIQNDSAGEQSLFCRNNLVDDNTAKASFSDLCAEQRQFYKREEIDFQKLNQEYNSSQEKQQNSYRDCNLSSDSDNPTETDQRKNLIYEYQLQNKEIQSAILHVNKPVRALSQFSNEEPIMTSMNTQQQQLQNKNYANVADDHQITAQSLTCISDVRDLNMVCSTIQDMPIREVRQPEIIRNKSKMMHRFSSDEPGINQLPHNLQQNQKGFEDALNDFATVSNNNFTYKIKRINQARSNSSSNSLSDKTRTDQYQAKSIEQTKQSLKGNFFQKEFELLTDKSKPDWQKFDALFNRIAVMLSICSSRTKTKQNLRTKKTNKELKINMVNINDGEEKKKKDAIICLKLIADVLLKEKSPLQQEVLHILSKHNVLKARNGIVNSLYDDMKNISKVNLKGPQYFENQTLQLGKRCDSQVSSIKAFNSTMALHEALNARVINETYKKIQMDKFPTVSIKLGQFLKNKKHVEFTQTNLIKTRPQSISYDVSHSRPRISKILQSKTTKAVVVNRITKTSSQMQPSTNTQKHKVQGTVQPIGPTAIFTKEQAKVRIDKMKPVQPNQFANAPDQFLTPRMTFLSETDNEKAFSSQRAETRQHEIQKSMLLASQMHNLNKSKVEFKFKP